MNRTACILGFVLVILFVIICCFPTDDGEQEHFRGGRHRRGRRGRGGRNWFGGHSMFGSPYRTLGSYYYQQPYYYGNLYGNENRRKINCENNAQRKYNICMSSEDTDQCVKNYYEDLSIFC